MSQDRKGELSHKQAGLTASTFSEACDLPRASRDCLNDRASKFHDLGFADLICYIHEGSHRKGELLDGKWG